MSHTLVTIVAAIVALVVVGYLVVMPILPQGGLAALHKPPPGAHGTKP
jgi:hypothetical protein